LLRLGRLQYFISQFCNTKNLLRPQKKWLKISLNVLDLQDNTVWIEMLSLTVQLSWLLQSSLNLWLNSCRSTHLVLVVTQKNTLGGGGLKVKKRGFRARHADSSSSGSSLSSHRQSNI
jgi:hypothetical protein